MIRNTTKRQKLGWVLFILYLCLLAYFMFFSESFGRTDTNRGYQYNLVPFKEISRYFRYYNTIGPLLFLINMVGNVAAFLPFGFFLPIISRRSKPCSSSSVWEALMWTICSSIPWELLLVM